MKKYLLILLFLVNYCIYSQIINPTPIGSGFTFSEKTSFEKAIIHFNDESSIEGIGRIKTIFTSQEEVIIFKIEEKDKDETWTVKDVKGLTIISDGDGVTDYEYLKVTKNSFAELYEVITEGNVKLYKKRKKITTTNPNIVTNLTGVPIGNSEQNSSTPPKTIFPSFTSVNERLTYYVKREAEPYPTKIRDNYIKSFTEYMKDCDIMVEKIKNHEYNFSELKDLVDYYNANCGE